MAVPPRKKQKPGKSAVGAYDAKTHLPRLLRQVARGERIMITKHGVPVAELGPAKPAPHRTPREAIEELREFRNGRKLDGLTIRELVDEGRR